MLQAVTWFPDSCLQDFQRYYSRLWLGDGKGLPYM